MIDIENIVLDRVTKVLRETYLAQYPGLTVYAVENPVPESFPCVTVVLTDNYTYQKTLVSNQGRENHAHITFTVNVYTNNAQDRKLVAKDIFNTVDLILQDLCLTRTYASYMPNIDRTIFRITGRYYGIVEKPIITEEGGETKETYLVYRE